MADHLNLPKGVAAHTDRVIFPSAAIYLSMKEKDADEVVGVKEGIEMTKNEFDAMMEKGLEQAKANEGRLAENVLADVVKGYERGEEKSGESFRHRTFEERVAEYGGKIGVDGEFDWGEPVGREIW